MYSLPTTVTVKNTEFHITNNGDFRMVLDCFSALNDDEISEDLRVLASLIIFYDEFSDILDVYENSEYIEQLCAEMFAFFNCGQTDTAGAVTNTPLVDWNKDSQIICAAINNVANTEIRSAQYLHWWTFLGYYMSIGESVFSTVVSIRDKITNNKRLEKWEKEFKQKNPDYFVWRKQQAHTQEMETAIRELWNNGGDS